MFYHRNDAVGRKMVREMLRFTIEAGVGGHKISRICETVVAGWPRAMFAIVHTLMVV